MIVRSFVFALAYAACASSAAAQQPAGHASHAAAAMPLARDEIAALARVQVAINVAHDSTNAQLAKSGNKTAQAQQQLKDKLRAHIQQILHHGGLTGAEYRRRTFFVSSDTATRRVFDSVVVAITGAPLPGYAARAAVVPVPAGPAGTHIGHVLNGFSDTPALQGLLPAAMAEARIAAQHATLATRQADNLNYMKTHVLHVIHALDPSVIATGPGLGYGVKKAAAGVVTHIELAAAAPGASPNMVAHAQHVVIAVRNTIARADQMLALAQKVQTAASAAAAAALLSQIVSLSDQLIAGADANNDGRITYDVGEGGLQHADEHVRLMLAGAR